MKYLDKWYIWFFMLIGLGITYFFIMAQVYAWHPLEIHFYANDEMVASTKNLFQTQRDMYFNECKEGCEESSKITTELWMESGLMVCYNSCINYYNKNESDYITYHS